VAECVIPVGGYTYLLRRVVESTFLNTLLTAPGEIATVINLHNSYNGLGKKIAGFTNENPVWVFLSAKIGLPLASDQGTTNVPSGKASIPASKTTLESTD
jgi:hypothetical protein